MRIGLARRGYSASGGAEAYLRRFAAGAMEAGHAVTLFVSPEWPEENAAGMKIARVPGNSPMHFARNLGRLRRTHPCDVLFSLERVWTCEVYRAGDGVHAAWLEQRRAFEPRWKSWARRFSAKHKQLIRLEETLCTGGAGRIIVNSRIVEKEMVARYKTARDRIRLIRNGIAAQAAPSPEERRKARERLGLDAGAFVILFAGTGWARKGLNVAIETYRRLREETQVELLVAGRREPGATRAEDVHFLGETPGIREPAAAADFFLLPTWYDPFSNATLEALQAGLPVFTTTANGAGEILEPGRHGEIFPPGDAAAAAAALRPWLERERVEQARLETHKLAADFTIERNVRETLAVLQEASRRHSPQRAATGAA